MLLYLLVALAVIVSQVALMVLFMVAPLFAIMAPHPTTGRHLFVRWFELVVGALVVRIFYSFFLSVLTVLAGVTTQVSSGAGWGLAAILQIALVVTAFIYRRPLAAIFSQATRIRLHHVDDYVSQGAVANRLDRTLERRRSNALASATAGPGRMHGSGAHRRYVRLGEDDEGPAGPGSGPGGGGAGGTGRRGGGGPPGGRGGPGGGGVGGRGGGGGTGSTGEGPVGAPGGSGAPGVLRPGLMPAGARALANQLLPGRDSSGEEGQESGALEGGIMFPPSSGGSEGRSPGRAAAARIVGRQARQTEGAAAATRSAGAAEVAAGAAGPSGAAGAAASGAAGSSGAAASGAAASGTATGAAAAGAGAATGGLALAAIAGGQKAIRGGARGTRWMQSRADPFILSGPPERPPRLPSPPKTAEQEVGRRRAWRHRTLELQVEEHAQEFVGAQGRPMRPVNPPRRRDEA
jgi:hypothetical protein